MTATAQNLQAAREEIVDAFQRAMTEHMRAHTDNTQVHADTLLASDYLNPYNVLLMLLETLPQAPAECADDLAQWRPANYEEHFQACGLRDSSLAIAAYRNAPAEARDAFDAAAVELEEASCRAVAGARLCLEAGDDEGLFDHCETEAQRLRALLHKTADIIDGIDGGKAPARQARIDALFD